MTKLTETKAGPQEDRGVYAHPFFQNLIKRSQRYLSLGYPVHFTGPTGIGKTTLALHIAKSRKRPVVLISGNKSLSNAELIGAFKGYNRKKVNDNYVRTVRKIEENVTEGWVSGRLYEAVKNGYTVVYDEFTRSKPEVNNLFLSVLEEKILPLYGTKRKDSHIRVHPDFSIIFTSNPAEYVGVYQTQDALLDRMISLPLKSLDQEAEATIVTERTNIDVDKAKSIVGFVHRVKDLCNNRDSSLSLRASIMIADVAERYQLPIDGNDKEFQELCLDITYFTLDLCTDDQEEDLQSKIIEACKKV
ncbi:gas vesicle protein GvpN [Halobacillus sp. K22]|uniref:gas vesicle protein GvpN n=1 Tax=Halobacillus sp. K22 TaxID=3457431 RepID=UPI003FCC812C